MNQPTPSPCIFVVESDDDVRPVLKYNLQNWGYELIMALDEEDAIRRTQGGGQRVNLILINQSGKLLDQLIVLGRQIRQSTGEDSRTPIIIIAENYGQDMEGQDILLCDHEYVTYLEDGQQLKNLLYRLCPVC